MSISGNIRAGAAYVEVTAQTSKLQRGLASAQAQLQQFGRSCASIGKDMLMLTGAFAAPLAVAVKGFAAFDDQMRLAKAVTKASRAEFESMTQVAAKLGRETSFTVKQVADGMVALGRMGFSPKEVEAAIAPTLDLARATGTDLGEAADIAANSMRIFGIEAERMSDVADVLTATANGSAQTLTDLFEALKMAGPQAKAAGENITDTSAAIGILANVGVKGSLAGTALRKSYSQFAKTKVQDKLKGIGIATVDASGNLRKMADIMADIGMAMSSMPSAEKISFAEEIFDIRGSLAGLSLGDNVKGLQAFIEKLQDIRGTAGNTAKEMDDGLGGSFRMLLSAVEGAMNAIAKALEGSLKPFVDRATEATLAVIKWIEANSGLVTSFAFAVAGAAALGAALIVIGTASKGAAAGIAVAGSAVKGFTFLQGLCIAQGAALKNSLSLIAAAFVNFRNTAIPAMVGTEQLCAALGLASSASNRAAASIVLMSNAEAAAAAKSFLAARWTAMAEALKHFRNSAVMATVATRAQGAAELAMSAKNAIISGWVGMTKALKGLSAATVAATAVTYAHTAAEAVCTAGTVALNKARRLAAATTALFTAANLKAVVSISAVAAGNFLLATAAKVAAIAMMGLTAVMSAIAAHPVAAALIALGVILAGVVLCLYRAANYTAKLSDQMSKLREKNDEVRKSDQLRMERLKQLSEKQHLTNAEMKEARRLAGELKSRYGDLGISISDNAMRLAAMNAESARLQAMEPEVREPEDLVKLQRLKALSLELRLDVQQQTEAETLIAGLSAKYGELGVAVDKASGKIVKLNSVAAGLREIGVKVSGTEDADKAARLRQLAELPRLDATGVAEANSLLEQLTSRYGDVGLAVDAATGRIIALTEAQKQFAEAQNIIQAGNDPLKETHLAQLERLKKLAVQEKLTAAEQTEAQRIVSALNGAYNGLGLGIDAVAGKLTAAASAQKKLNDAMKQAMLSELDAEIAEMETNIRELQKENDALMSYGNHNLWSQISGRQKETVGRIETNGERMAVYRQKINAVKRRRKAVEQEKPGAMTGSDGTTESSTAEKIETEKQRRRQSQDAADDAAKRVAEIDKKLARERKTELENEIDDIVALRDEYKALIQTMLDYEKSKPEDGRDNEKISELEGKLAQADKTAQERIAKAQEKAAEKMRKDAADFQKSFNDAQKDVQLRRAEDAQDRNIEKTMETDKSAGIRMIQELVRQYQLAAETAKRQFEQELQAAQADGKIDGGERDRISEAQAAYTRAESLVDKYSGKLREAQSGTRSAAEKSSRVNGSFLAAALNAALGGGGNEAERTANATEMMAKNSRETNRLLKRMGKNGNAALTYT